MENHQDLLLPTRMGVSMRRTSSKGVEVVYTDSAPQIFGVILEEIAITDLNFPLEV